MNVTQILFSSGLFVFVSLSSPYANAFCMVSSNYDTIGGVLSDNVLVGCAPNTPITNLVKEVFENALLQSNEGIRTGDAGFSENTGEIKIWAPLGQLQSGAYFSKDSLNPNRYQYWFNVMFKGELAERFFKVLSASKPVQSGDEKYLFHIVERKDADTMSRIQCVTQNGKVDSCGIWSWTFYNQIP